MIIISDIINPVVNREIGGTTRSKRKTLIENTGGKRRRNAPENGDAESKPNETSGRIRTISDRLDSSLLLDKGTRDLGFPS